MKFTKYEVQRRALGGKWITVYDARHDKIEHAEQVIDHFLRTNAYKGYSRENFRIRKVTVQETYETVSPDGVFRDGVRLTRAQANFLLDCVVEARDNARDSEYVQKEASDAIRLLLPIANGMK